MKRNKGKMRVIVMAILVLAMLVSGCGKKATPEALLKDIAAKMKDVESTSTNMLLEIAVSAEGEAVELKMDIDSDAVLKSAESYAKGNIDVNMLGMKNAIEMELYQVEEDGKYVNYAGILGQWGRQELDEKPQITTELFDEFGKAFAEFQLNKNLVKVNGKECFELKGDVSSAVVSYMMYSDLSKEMGLEEYFDEDELEDMKIPCTLAIYKKDVLPAQITLDMKGMFDSMSGMEEVDVDKCSLVVTYNEYNKVGKIEVPEEVLEEAGGIDAYDGLDGLDGFTDSGLSVEPAAPSSELGKDWTSFTVQIDDKVLSLPFAFSELEALGFKLDDHDITEDYILNPKDSEFVFLTDSRENEIGVAITNNSGEAKKILECEVTEVSVDRWGIEGGLSVLLPGGIYIGMPKDEALAVYDKYDEFYDGTYSENYGWWTDDDTYASCSVNIDKETGKVDDISIGW